MVEVQLHNNTLSHDEDTPLILLSEPFAQHFLAEGVSAQDEFAHVRKARSASGKRVEILDASQLIVNKREVLEPGQVVGHR